MSVGRIGTPERWAPVYQWIPVPGEEPQVTPSVREVPAPAYPCRFVKCDSMMLPGDSPDDPGTMELAVCYEVWDDDDGDWDIGVTRLWWDANTNLEAGPTGVQITRFDWDIGGDAYETDDEMDERYPDLAYDPETADIYLVWSDFQNPSTQGDPNRAFIHYRRFHRSDSEWHEYFEVQTNHTFSGHLPRIDVGRVDDVFGQEDNVVAVAITYTAQFCGLQDPEHIGFHIHVHYWRHELDDGNKAPNGSTVFRICLRNWADNNAYWNLSAGMPYIDIAPYNSQDNDGAIVFVQIVGSDLHGPVAEIWEINSIGPAYEMVSLTDDQGEQWFDGLYPSIAIYYGLEHTAAVTYFRQEDANGNQYRPWVAELDLITNQIDPSSDQEIVWLQPMQGIFNSDQIPFINPGAATAIQTLDDKYWVAWCEEGWQMEWAPTRVMGAWGWIGL